jgi:RHS repeat-associated protein
VDTQLFYVNARYYSGNVGRFLSQDSMSLSTGFDLTDPQSLNAYAYARNNPLRYTDPNGEWFMDMVKTAGGYTVGLFQGVTTAAVDTAVFAGMAVGHPIQTGKAAGSFFAEAGKTATDIATSPQARTEISQGVGITYNEFETKSAFEQGRTIGNITGQLEFAVGAGYKTTANIATKGNTVFPENPNYLYPESPRGPNGSIYPEDGVRIRSEQHAFEAGKNNSPRHVNPHYHVDVLKPCASGFNNRSNYNILKPETYVPRWGKGFLPREKIPKFKK